MKGFFKKFQKVKLKISRIDPEDWHNDTPITNIGHTQARLTGEEMKLKNVDIHHVYASPAFRCVETASSVLKGLNLILCSIFLLY